MRTIGVLGGFGPQATIDFETRAHLVAQNLIPQQANQGYPPMLVYYHRHAPMLVNDDGSPVMPVQPDPRLLAAARHLGACADVLVIISNGAHVLQADIEQAAGRKVVSMIEATLAEVKRRNLARVGVLGLFSPRIYQTALAQQGIACETIDGDLQQRLNLAIFAVMEGRADEVRAVAREAVATLRARCRSDHPWMYRNSVYAAGGGGRPELDQPDAAPCGGSRAGRA